MPESKQSLKTSINNLKATTKLKIFKLTKILKTSIHSLRVNTLKTIKNLANFRGRISPRQFAFIIILLVGLIIFMFTILKDLPSPSRLSSDEFPVSTKILDRNGQILYEIYADQNRTPIKIKDLPDYVLKATISIEDKNFYKHHGFDLQGISRAFLNTLFKQNLQGGSTITQQLVKTTLLSPERTIKRKLREAILALATELRYSKDEIIQMYLNHVPYGGTAYGIEQASLTYFNKSAKDLKLEEAALLAGLPQAPTRYSPFGSNPDAAKNRQANVLKRMFEDDYIDSDQLQSALDTKLEYAPQSQNILAPHFSLFIKDLLVEKYSQPVVEKGGLIVTTSLDLDIQKQAEIIIATESAKLESANVSNAAALVTKPRTGEILAMVGSRDYFNAEIDGNVNITTRLRQPGSSIKPINYAVGLIKGHTPATMFLDVPSCFNAPGQPSSYCPKNYDNTFHGPTHMRFALGNSYNIPAVKMLASNSVEAMVATASAMGITSYQDPKNYGLSLTLGGGEVRMIDMAVAFGVFSNQGLKVDLTPILSVKDYHGNVLESINLETEIPAGEKAISPEVAYLISHMLLDNNARVGAFGSSSELVIRDHTVSAKTGTTDDLRDNWTIGFTPSYLVSTWVGNNDNTPMHPYLVSGVSGAAPIWHDIMEYVLKDEPDEWPKKPDTIIGLQVCNLTGLRPNPESPCETRYEYFIKGQEPNMEPILKRDIWIDKSTKRPPVQGKTDDLELQEHIVVSDPVQKDYCVDCEKEIDEEGKIKEAPYTINIYPPEE